MKKNLGTLFWEIFCPETFGPPVNGGKLLENKRETPINWTSYSKEPFQILRRAIKDKDADVGKIIAN